MLSNDKDFVLLPYEITLLSNGQNSLEYEVIVLLPYEITLSNIVKTDLRLHFVLLPYEITLLSNLK